VPGNWKLEAIIRSLGDAGQACSSRRIAEDIDDMTPRQLSNYIANNLLHKYVTATREPIRGNNCAPWLNLYTLTETGIDYYHRKLAPKEASG